MSVDTAGHSTPGSPTGSRSRMSMGIAHGGSDDRPAREGCSKRRAWSGATRVPPPWRCSRWPVHGANTAVFSIAHAYLLRDWQVRSPQELVFVRARASTGERIGSFPWRTIEQLRGSHPTLTAVSAFDESTVTVTIGGRAEVVYGDFVTGDYFEMLGLRPALGRLLTTADDRAGQPPVAVLSHAYWTNRFGADPYVIGRMIAVKDVTCTIVGVTPRDCFGRETAGQAAAVTVPMVLQPRLALKDHLDFEMLGRLNAGAAPDIARAQLGGVSSGASRRASGERAGQTHRGAVCAARRHAG
jgi:hypothetical protein